ncbi:MAG: CHASE9 sensor domain-containing protein, partial [Escherichia coli]|nr:CHASE9 sensor domain-containing protein [Escherichia coli]
MLSLYEKIKIRLIILFLLAALSFIGLFFIINYQLVSERAVKRADSRFELIQKNVGYFFKDIERSALTLKDSLYLLKNTEEIQRAVILKEGANKRGNSSRLTQSFHFFMFEPIFSPVNA